MSTAVRRGRSDLSGATVDHVNESWETRSRAVHVKARRVLSGLLNLLPTWRQLLLHRSLRRAHGTISLRPSPDCFTAALSVFPTRIFHLTVSASSRNRNV